jgi:hypothetical protein
MLQWRKTGLGDVVETPSLVDVTVGDGLGDVVEAPSLVDVTVGDGHGVEPSTYPKMLPPLRCGTI